MENHETNFRLSSQVLGIRGKHERPSATNSICEGLLHKIENFNSLQTTALETIAPSKIVWGWGTFMYLYAQSCFCGGEKYAGIKVVPCRLNACRSII